MIYFYSTIVQLKMYRILRTLAGCAIVACLALAVHAEPSLNPSTFCNPLNLNYPFVYSQSHRETGEPTPILYKGDYYLFASWLRGYWWSTSLSNDFSTWTFVPHTLQTMPIIDGMHLTVWEYEGYLYMEANEATGIYRTNSPKSGNAWEKVNDNKFEWDPSVFKGYDNFYYMTAVSDRILRLDPAAGWTFSDTNSSSPSSGRDVSEYGWQQSPYDGSEGWHEGSNMFKKNGRYYFNWSTPGTELDEYCETIRRLDSSFSAGSPLGKTTSSNWGWTPQKSTPFCFKPTGFIAGPGHGQLFDDVTGIWKFSTMNVSARDAGWERLLGIAPAYVDADNEIVCDQIFGDYPQFIPGKRTGGNPRATGENFTGWMLLSYLKPATASSTLSQSQFAKNQLGNPVTISIANAFDESIKTWWSASTENAGEWLSVDLQSMCTVRGIQVAFAEEGITNTSAAELYHAYTIEISTNGQTWTMLIDKSANRTDVPYDYSELIQPVSTRYVRIKNIHMSGQGKFALSGFRIFGNANGTKPPAVNNFSIQRSVADPRTCTVTWPKVAGAFGYSLRFGIAPDRLYYEYQVLNGKYVKYPAGWIQYAIHDTTITMSSLNKSQAYYFRVDAFNENGITIGTMVKSDAAVGVDAEKKPSVFPMHGIAFLRNGELALNGFSITNGTLIRVMDAQGRVLFSQIAQSNIKSIPFKGDGRSILSGIKFVEIVSGNVRSVTKINLVGQE